MGTKHDAVILVVEDEDSLRSLFCEGLENSGYDVLTAASATEAVAVAEQAAASIDLLLTDVRLPDFTGPIVAERIRAQSRHARTRVLFMSGNFHDELIATRLIDHAAPFLQKPFTNRHLKLAIQELLK